MVSSKKLSLIATFSALSLILVIVSFGAVVAIVQAQEGEAFIDSISPYEAITGDYSSLTFSGSGLADAEVATVFAISDADGQTFYPFFAPTSVTDNAIVIDIFFDTTTPPGSYTLFIELTPLPGMEAAPFAFELFTITGQPPTATPEPPPEPTEVVVEPTEVVVEPTEVVVEPTEVVVEPTEVVVESTEVVVEPTEVVVESTEVVEETGTATGTSTPTGTPSSTPTLIPFTSTPMATSCSVRRLTMFSQGP